LAEKDEGRIPFYQLPLVLHDEPQPITTDRPTLDQSFTYVPLVLWDEKFEAPGRAAAQRESDAAVKRDHPKSSGKTLDAQQADRRSNLLPAVSEEAVARKLGKEQQQREGVDAMAEYRARQRATQRNTARLRALRLAAAATETAKPKKDPS